jgi:hypothetical protein
MTQTNCFAGLTGTVIGPCPKAWPDHSGEIGTGSATLEEVNVASFPMLYRLLVVRRSALPMNRTPVISLFLILTISTLHAVSPPTDVAEVRWGSSPAAVRQTLSRRPGVTFLEETPTTMTFKGGTFAGHEVEAWRFEFQAGKFYKATISFVRPPGKDAKGKWHVDHIWGDLQKLVAEKYGRGEKLSDSGHGEFLWTFPEPSRRASKTIDLYYGFGSRLDITYTDNAPGPLTTPIPKAKAKDDL